MPKTYLSTKVTEIAKAAFPVIDAHNHLWGSRDIDRIVDTMNEAGVVSFANLTGNLEILFSGGGYTASPCDISGFIHDSNARYPGRFYCFTMAGFAHPAGLPLFHDHKKFVEESIEILNLHVGLGAKGLKILKELGLQHRDSNGDLIPVDDPRLFPIWEEAGRLNIPVLIHQADPSGFFEPITPDNEHYGSLLKYPSWSFADPKYPRKADLLKRRDNLIRLHPHTTFILPHVANHAENISSVSQLLSENPNVYIDFSARIDELGRQPYSAREFFIKHQDQIIFGTDMPANIDSSVGMYRTYFRFLETYDESFFSPDYDGTFNRARWPICGIGLPKVVLEKIYHKNILKVIPSLESCFLQITNIH
jgi:predicted TIM-barrel fold metal-dependent hydrolase